MLHTAMQKPATLALAALLFALSGSPAPVRAADAAPAAASPARTPLVSLDIAYADSDLREPGLATTALDPDLVDWKMPELARLMQERAPKVLAANGLGGVGVSVPVPESGAALDVEAVAPGRPVVLLRIASIRKWKPTLFSTAGSITFEAQLFDRAAAAAPALWRMKLGAGLGFDPVLGVLKTNRVDAAWVDRILLLALDQMAERGLVQLAGPKAAKPKD